MQIIIIDGFKAKSGNLYHNPSNQIRRKVGKFSSVYCGGVSGGTVMDAAGKCWDWWPTDEAIAGTNFKVLKIVPAR